MKTKLSAFVALALLMTSCGGTDKAATTAQPSAAPPVLSPAPASSAPANASPTVFVSGRLSDEVITALVDDGGTVNEDLRRQALEAFVALPEDQQLAVLSDLSLRVELEAAAVSGLEAAIGGSAATEAALKGAWAQVGSQVAAVDASAPLEPAVTPAGLRRSAPSAGTVGVVGVMMGVIGLSSTAEAIVSAANNLKPGEPAETGSDGMKMTGSLEKSAIEMEFNGQQDGVDIAFKASAVVHPCPTVDGSFDIQATIDTKTSKGGAGQNATIDLKITGHVDDDAKIVDKNIDIHTQWSDLGGGKGQFVDFTMSGPAGIDRFVNNRSGGTVSKDFYSMTTFISAAFGLMLADRYIKAAENGWLSGRCVKLEPTASPGPKGLKPGSTSDITAAPRSKIDGGPVGGSVTAALTAGGASVEPVSTKVPADATFTYLAPDEKNKTGTVSLEARSKRGVAKAAIDFDTAGVYTASGGSEVTFSGTVADLAAPFTLSGAGQGFNVTFSFTPSNETAGALTYTGTGDGFTMNGTGTYTIAGADPDPLTLTYNADGCVSIGGCRATTNAITLTRTSG